jgi:hypothetical protein
MRFLSGGMALSQRPALIQELSSDQWNMAMQLKRNHLRFTPAAVTLRLGRWGQQPGRHIKRKPDP